MTPGNLPRVYIMKTQARGARVRAAARSGSTGCRTSGIKTPALAAACWWPPLLLGLLLGSCSSAADTCSGGSGGTMARVDAHVHVWGLEGFTEAQPSPAELIGTAERLRERLTASSFDSVLIVQPINYQFDHAPVAAVLATEPAWRGMALADPSAEPDAAVAALDSLVEQGFVGMRFNPALGSAGWMVGATGRALYARCGALGLPIGVMCMSGLLQSAGNLDELMALSPSTPLIIDHWGFFRQPPGSPTGEPDEAAWSKLLSWAAVPSVFVKVSADFRVSDNNADSPAVSTSTSTSDEAAETVSKGAAASVRRDLVPRAAQLLSIFGAERLLFGSDFPWVDGQPRGHDGAVSSAEALWREAGADDSQLASIMGGTAARLFKMDQ